MKNKPGISWGLDHHINLIKSSIGYLAVYYDSKESKGEIIKVFNPKCYIDYYEMLDRLTLYNYNTCILCPIVKMEMDATS